MQTTIDRSGNAKIRINATEQNVLDRAAAIMRFIGRNSDDVPGTKSSKLDIADELEVVAHVYGPTDKQEPLPTSAKK